RSSATCGIWATSGDRLLISTSQRVMRSADDLPFTAMVVLLYTSRRYVRGNAAGPVPSAASRGLVRGRETRSRGFPPGFFSCSCVSPFRSRLPQDADPPGHLQIPEGDATG